MPKPHQFFPADYGATLNAIQQRIRQERTRVILSANAASLILLYWDIGKMIVDRQSREGWRAKVIDPPGRDLRKSFPEMQGFSTRNLELMRRFAQELRDDAIAKQLASQLPWWHLVRTMQRVKTPEAREWYLREAARQGWSRRVLELQLLGNAFERRGKALTDFAAALPSAEAAKAIEVFKDPYVFDFLAATDLRREAAQVGFDWIDSRLRRASDKLPEARDLIGQITEAKNDSRLRSFGAFFGSRSLYEFKFSRVQSRWAENTSFQRRHRRSPNG